MYHQLNLFSVMSPQAVRLSTSVTCFVHCHVPVDGARHSNTDIDTPSSPRSTTKATPFRRSKLESILLRFTNTVFELRIVRVDVEKLREHRRERCSRISSLDTDVHRQRFHEVKFLLFQRIATKHEMFSFMDCHGINFYYFQA